MKKISTALLILLMTVLLNGCSDSKDIDTITGSSKDGTSQPTANGQYPDVSRHGILWKPVSDSNRMLAILLAPSYGVPKVTVMDMNKRVIDTGRFVYKSHPNRATYRFALPGKSFPKPCLLQVGNQIFMVPDGSKRYE